MELYLNLVLCASVSLRGSSRVMEMVLKFFGLHAGAPSWWCGRLWVLRLGYFKLTRAKERAPDWAWVIDHTVQLGSRKCFVILGVRLSDLPPAGQCLRHEDMEPITLAPVEESTGEIVFRQLEEAAKLTGAPRQIISDHGTDLVHGVEMFCRKHPETCSTYDIKHKTAAVLKRELKDDARWQSFTQLCARTSSRVRQTELAFLCPPNQRSKARYMNVDVLIAWGAKVLAFMDAPTPDDDVNPDALHDKLGWILEYRRDLLEWCELLEIVSRTEHFVRANGLYRGCLKELKEDLSTLAHTQRGIRVRSELLGFVGRESFKARGKERLIGSSEVIESVFGKLKHLEGDQASGGFTGLLLALAAMVSTTTREVVVKAMETVSTATVLDWKNKIIGMTVQARRKALSLLTGAEQKQEEFEGAVAT
jgi:hypothetical protein